MIEIKVTLPLRTVTHITRYDDTALSFSEFCRSYSAFKGESEQFGGMYDGHLTVTESGESRLCFADGENGIQTEISFIPGHEAVTVKRGGSVESIMHFHPGTDTDFTYRTPYGEMAGRIHPLRLENTITVKGGYLMLAYLCEIGGARQKNLLKITLNP